MTEVVCAICKLAYPPRAIRYNKNKITGQTEAQCSDCRKNGKAR